MIQIEEDRQSDITHNMFMRTTNESATHFSYRDTQRIRYILPNEKKLAQTALEFFLPTQKRLMLIGKRLLHPRRTIVEKFFYRADKLLDTVKNLADFREVEVAISIGTPGPYSKNTILLLDNKARPLAVAKHGTSLAAINLLQNEAIWLGKLALHENMRGATPSLITAGEISGGFIVVQTVVKGKSVKHQDMTLILSFLQMLQSSGDQSIDFLHSVMLRNMENRLERIRLTLTSQWRVRAEQSIDLLKSGFLKLPCKTMVAHRDFSPWNMYVTNKGIYVFDWEYASDGYVPLYDIVHFLLMPFAVKQKLSIKKVEETFRVIMDWCCKKHLSPHSPESIKLQTLAYMLDLCLFYLDSNNGDDTGDGVVANYAKLIDTYKEWHIPDNHRR